MDFLLPYSIQELRLTNISIITNLEIHVVLKLM